MSMPNLLLYYEEFHIFSTRRFNFFGFFRNSRNEQLPVGMMAQLVERYTSIAEVKVQNHFRVQNFQAFLSL